MSGLGKGRCPVCRQRRTLIRLHVGGPVLLAKHTRKATGDSSGVENCPGEFRQPL